MRSPTEIAKNARISLSLIVFLLLMAILSALFWPRVDAILYATPDDRTGDTVHPIPGQGASSVAWNGAAVESQGVAAHGAKAWHSAGYAGSNSAGRIKVGIIDTGFAGFSALQGSELPANTPTVTRVTARCYPQNSSTPSSDIADCDNGEKHGTAVAEAIIDIAPEVDLYIATASTYAQLRDAVE